MTPYRDETRESAHGPHDAHGSAAPLALALGALGVVYGDIGTSPLYALKECVHGAHALPITNANVFGLLSLMFWSITLVISIKYISFVMRANNQGEGGGLAMLALLQDVLRKPKKLGAVGAIPMVILFGACLLYGEGIITPAISVLSAVEGLGVATHTLERFIVPITVVILVALFAIQKRGTATIGRVFGPIMIVWFATLAILGGIAIARYPEVLTAIDPRYGVRLFIEHKFHAFVILGSVVLCITGGEALYADMGHFGRKPIRLAWFAIAMPALLLNYFGQAALLLSTPPESLADVVRNPFYSLVPDGPAIYPLVFIATCATVIASQALISGAYSLTRQAVQLGYLPRVHVLHTSSETEGQIYIPEVNNALAIGCIALVLGFRSSSALAAAYGISVMGTMAITSIAFFLVCTRKWKWPVHRALLLVGLFLIVELAFFSSNLLKFFNGGFVPVVIAISLFSLMIVWKRGRALLGDFFVRASKPLDEFLGGLKEGIYRHRGTKGKGEVTVRVTRVDGVAVFLTSNPSGTPPLLMHHVKHNKAIQAHVLLLTVINESVPRVIGSRVEVDALEEGFFRVRIRVGFMESPDVPRALGEAITKYHLPFEVDEITYYLGRETLLATKHGKMGERAEKLFAFLTRNSQQATAFFGIPPERVVEIGMQVDL
jgi:KUP system potassium uptake protein